MELSLANFDALKRLNFLGGLIGFPLRNSGGIEKKETSFDFANWQSRGKNVGLIKIKWKVHQLHSFHLPSRYLETNDQSKDKQCLEFIQAQKTVLLLKQPFLHCHKS